MQKGVLTKQYTHSSSFVVFVRVLLLFGATQIRPYPYPRDGYIKVIHLKEKTELKLSKAAKQCASIMGYTVSGNVEEAANAHLIGV